jgi:hypothetical protein
VKLRSFNRSLPDGGPGPHHREQKKVLIEQAQAGVDAARRRVDGIQQWTIIDLPALVGRGDEPRAEGAPFQKMEIGTVGVAACGVVRAVLSGDTAIVRLCTGYGTRFVVPFGEVGSGKHIEQTMPPSPDVTAEVVLEGVDCVGWVPGEQVSDLPALQIVETRDVSNVVVGRAMLFVAKPFDMERWIEREADGVDAAKPSPVDESK